MARKFLIFLAVFLITANVMIVLLVFLGGKSAPARPLPNPNGYDDFVKAGRLVVSNDNKLASSNQIANFKTMTQEELAAAVATNAEALRLMRIGLTHDSLVLLEYSTNFTEKMMDQLSGLKRLGILLAAEGRLAEQEGRTNDAVQSYLDGMRYGEEAGRGGYLICRLVGLACENIASKPLGRLANSLDAQHSRETARAVEAIDAKEEPLQDTLNQEQLFVKKTADWRWKLASLFNKKLMAPVINSVTAKVQSNTLYRRQLMVDFATHAHELERGKRPQSWADLVPAYLKAVPIDPTTGTNIVFTP